MGGDWLDDLSAPERDEWDTFVDHFRRDALQKMDDSAFVMSLVPSREHFDVKFAVELGAAIMLNKPLLAVAMPGATISEKLRLVADEVIAVDVDTEAGRDEIAAALRRLMEAS